MQTAGATWSISGGVCNVSGGVITYQKQNSSTEYEIYFWLYITYSHMLFIVSEHYMFIVEQVNNGQMGYLPTSNGTKLLFTLDAYKEL